MAYPGSPQPGPAVRVSLTTVQWLHVSTFGLGLISLFLGFAPWIKAEVIGAEGLSAYEGGGGLSPALSFVAGVIALLAILPGGTGRPGPLVPALTAGITLNFLFSLFAIPDGVAMVAGGVLATLFSVFQTTVAVFAYYLDVRRPRPNPVGFPGHPNPTGYPPTGQFPPPQPGPFPPHQPQ